MRKMTLKQFFKNIAFIWTLGYLWLAFSAGSTAGFIFSMTFLFVPWLIGVAILAVLAWTS